MHHWWKHWRLERTQLCWWPHLRQLGSLEQFHTPIGQFQLTVQTPAYEPLDSSYWWLQHGAWLWVITVISKCWLRCLRLVAPRPQDNAPYTEFRLTVLYFFLPAPSFTTSSQISHLTSTLSDNPIFLPILVDNTPVLPHFGQPKLVMNSLKLFISTSTFP